MSVKEQATGGKEQLKEPSPLIWKHLEHVGREWGEQEVGTLEKDAEQEGQISDPASLRAGFLFLTVVCLQAFLPGTLKNLAFQTGV